MLMSEKALFELKDFEKQPRNAVKEKSNAE